MENKVCYLFGAGASAKALPVVNSIPERLGKTVEKIETFRRFIKSEKARSINRMQITEQIMFDSLLGDMRWLQQQVQEHDSIDVYAKKLHLKKDSYKLNILKVCLSVFFILEQLENKPDSRYDVFFSSILDDNAHALPAKIKIVSWNYDFQFERSYSDFIDDDYIDNVQLALGINTKFTKHENDPNKFGIFKLNGTTILGSMQHSSTVHSFFKSLSRGIDEINFQRLLYTYGLAKYDSQAVYSHLSFSWEYENERASVLNRALASVKDSSILVIIGYSFPYFNRNVDQELLSGLAKSLKKIYIQDPFAESVEQSLSSVWPTGVKQLAPVLLKSTSQFYLPPEL